MPRQKSHSKTDSNESSTRLSSYSEQLKTQICFSNDTNSTNSYEQRQSGCRRTTSEGALFKKKKVDAPPSIPRRKTYGDALLCKRVVAAATRTQKPKSSYPPKRKNKSVSSLSTLSKALSSVPVVSPLQSDHSCISVVHVLDDVVSLLSDSA
jgi:hypothetical protein